MSLKRSFPPVVDEATRVLILGSLPGEVSLAKTQYYGHPRNLFWGLMGEVVGEPLVPLAYEDRLAALLRHRVGLWDVINAAERKGSLDTAIRNAAHNDLVQLVTRLPNLAAIGFNGATSARIGRKMLAGAAAGVALIDLPSSSPAYASMAWEQKLDRWSPLRAFLTTAD